MGISAPVTLKSQQVTFGPTAMTANVQWVEVDGSLTYTNTDAIVMPYSTAAGPSTVSISTGPLLNYLVTPAGETLLANAGADVIALAGTNVTSVLCVTVTGSALPSAPSCSLVLDSIFYFPDAATAQTASSILIENMLNHHALIAHG
jgi:hypothetical protein